MLYGLDLSVHDARNTKNPEFWNALKDSKFTDFIILRLGYGSNEPEQDDLFLYHYEQARKIGVRQIGVYWFNYSLTPEDMHREANFAIDMVKQTGIGLELPIFCDIEDNAKWDKSGFDHSPENITAMVAAWKEEFEKSGLHTGIYSNDYYFSTFIDWQSLNLPVWVAHYGVSEPDLKGFIWQYSKKETVGRFGPFDANVIFEPGE